MPYMTTIHTYIGDHTVHVFVSPINKNVTYTRLHISHLIINKNGQVDFFSVTLGVKLKLIIFFQITVK